jgi:hypothetical protein
VAINTMRLLAFPLRQEVIDFIDRHDHVFVIEQNRDGQMRMLLINEAQSAAGETAVDPALSTACRSPPKPSSLQITALLPRLNSPMPQKEIIPGDTP